MNNPELEKKFDRHIAVLKKTFQEVLKGQLPDDESCCNEVKMLQQRIDILNTDKADLFNTIENLEKKIEKNEQTIEFILHRMDWQHFRNGSRDLSGNFYDFVPYKKINVTFHFKTEILPKSLKWCVFHYTKNYELLDFIEYLQSNDIELMRPEDFNI